MEKEEHDSKKFGIGRAEITFFICEAVCILFFGLFTEYKETSDPQIGEEENALAAVFIHDKYPLFQDVHVMIFIGFGFLMVFLKNHSWCSIGFNYLVACWAIQICILFTGFWHNICDFYHDHDHEWEKIPLTIEKLILADFGAGAVLISFGAILGKCSIYQLWVMATFEVFFYCLNEAILMDIFLVADIGGSMVIHTFGAFFGLSVALFYQCSAAIEDKMKMGVGNYLSDLVSMIGTLFLFCYWPSFNGALGSGATMERAIINTYLSISCSVIAAIIVAKLTHGGKLEMEIILNASIAGGVAVGASADLIVLPFGAMILGFVTGTVSSLGFAYLSKFLQKKINLHDSCGVLNLHGMPGVIGGLVSAIIASRNPDTLGDEQYAFIFKAEGRSGPTQAGYQLAGLALSLGIAIFTGLFTGYVTSRSWFLPPPPEALFDDRHHWAECEIEHEQLHKLKEGMQDMEYSRQQSKHDIKNRSNAINDEYAHEGDEDPLHGNA